VKTRVLRQLKSQQQPVMASSENAGEIVLGAGVGSTGGECQGV